jgi:hypothetical protein
MDTDVITRLRASCAEVAARAKHVHINEAAIGEYARTLPSVPNPSQPVPPPDRERQATFWLTLDAINFGSGWFPTLNKRPGHSGYHTIAAGLTDHGRFTAAELRTITPAEIADVLGQDPTHELMALFARSLNDLGTRVGPHPFTAIIPDSAADLVTNLSTWECFADTSTYDELQIPFLKRAQIAAADLHRAGVAHFEDLSSLTMFADNLVPHVLRLDRILRFDPDLTTRIDRQQLIEHGSPEEVEIRACALHAVELIVAARPGACAAEIDQVLWNRGSEPRYKASPRHRSRCTAY